LATSGHLEQTREPVQGGGEVISSLRFSYPRMQSHPDPHRASTVRPRLLQQRVLRVESGCYRIWSSREGSLDAIPDDLEYNAIVRRNTFAQQLKVVLDRTCHCCPVALPERGTPLDVGEEEGDGAGGQVGHGSFQTLSWMSFCPIVA
jgi:hypothetical protein